MPLYENEFTLELAPHDPHSLVPSATSKVACPLQCRLVRWRPCSYSPLIAATLTLSNAGKAGH
jgi:hypothetical protein